MEATLTLQPDTEAVAAMPSISRVVVPTNTDDQQLDLARRAATMLAVEHGWQIVLYDRSAERWTDTPHASGPHAVDELDAGEREHLVRQMRDIEAAGVQVTAWLATVPSISAMADVIQELDVDAVLMPKELEKPRLMDRLLEGPDPAKLVDRVVKTTLDEAPTFLVIAEDGKLTVERSSEAA